LEEIAAEGVASGQFADVSPEVITVGAWGVVHGLVSLELSGNLPQESDVSGVYEQVLRAHASGWLRTT
jgi:hypothetical protein